MDRLKIFSYAAATDSGNFAKQIVKLKPAACRFIFDGGRYGQTFILAQIH